MARLIITSLLLLAAGAINAQTPNGTEPKRPSEPQQPATDITLEEIDQAEQQIERATTLQGQRVRALIRVLEFQGDRGDMQVTSLSEIASALEKLQNDMKELRESLWQAKSASDAKIEAARLKHKAIVKRFNDLLDQLARPTKKEPSVTADLSKRLAEVATRQVELLSNTRDLTGKIVKPTAPNATQLEAEQKSLIEMTNEILQSSQPEILSILLRDAVAAMREASQTLQTNQPALAIRAEEKALEKLRSAEQVVAGLARLDAKKDNYLQTLQQQRDKTEQIKQEEQKIVTDLHDGSRDGDNSKVSQKQSDLQTETKKVGDAVSANAPTAAEHLQMAQELMTKVNDSLNSPKPEIKTAATDSIKVVKSLEAAGKELDRHLNLERNRVAAQQTSAARAIQKSLVAAENAESVLQATIHPEDDFPILGQGNSNSCGPCCAWMVLKRLGEDPEIGRIKRIAGNWLSEVPTLPDGLVDVYHDYEYQADVVRINSAGELLSAIDARRYPILLVRANNDPGAFHWIVAYHHVGNKVCIADPAANRGAGYLYKNEHALDAETLFRAMKFEVDYVTGESLDPGPGAKWLQSSNARKMVVVGGHYDPVLGFFPQIARNGIWGLINGKTLSDLGLAFVKLGEKMGILGYPIIAVGEVVRFAANVVRWVVEVFVPILHGPVGDFLEDVGRKLGIKIGGDGDRKESEGSGGKNENKPGDNKGNTKPGENKEEPKPNPQQTAQQGMSPMAGVPGSQTGSGAPIPNPAQTPALPLPMGTPQQLPPTGMTPTVRMQPGPDVPVPTLPTNNGPIGASPSGGEAGSGSTPNNSDKGSRSNEAIEAAQAAAGQTVPVVPKELRREVQSAEGKLQSAKEKAAEGKNVSALEDIRRAKSQLQSAANAIESSQVRRSQTGKLSGKPLTPEIGNLNTTPREVAGKNQGAAVASPTGIVRSGPVAAIPVRPTTGESTTQQPNDRLPAEYRPLIEQYLESLGRMNSKLNKQ